jgi:hypothetical protein
MDSKILVAGLCALPFVSSRIKRFACGAFWVFFVAFAPVNSLPEL